MSKKEGGPAAIDSETGRMINPHNPEFITKVPWYLGEASGPTLKHHNVQKADHYLSLNETDALIQNKEALKLTAATGYRKGACKNCGSMTHKVKDCVERPRSSKQSAWKSGKNIAADEATLRLEDHGKISFDAKRDLYMGYNPEEYAKVIDKYDRMDDIRRKHRQEEKEKKKLEDDERRRKEKEDKKRRKKEAADAVAAAKRALSTVGGEGDGDGNGNGNGSGVIERDEGGGDCRRSSGEFGGRDAGVSITLGDTAEAEKDSDNSDSDSDYDSDEDDNSDDEDYNDDFIAKDEDAKTFGGRSARQGGVGGAQMKNSVANLRIREDTPKYLRNLSLDSAFYDPKSRSMRANPLPNEHPEDLPFAGDNFVRHTGDAIKLAQTQVLCWEMQARGETIDVLSNPSQSELMHTQFKEKKKMLEEEKKRAIFDKYGGEELLHTKLDPRLRLGQTEAFLQYAPDGRVLKGPGKVPTKTKYEEDIFLNNHTTVWGSYFSRQKRAWGFACCHSLIKNSYCVGEIGKHTNDAATEVIDSNQVRRMLEKQETLLPSTYSADLNTNKSSLYGESSIGVNARLDPNKLQESLKREDTFQREKNRDDGDDRKRSYNSMSQKEISEEDMEAYRIKRVQRDDPMANWSDEL